MKKQQVIGFAAILLLMVGSTLCTFGCSQGSNSPATTTSSTTTTSHSTITTTSTSTTTTSINPLVGSTWAYSDGMSTRPGKRSGAAEQFGSNLWLIGGAVSPDDNLTSEVMAFDGTNFGLPIVGQFSARKRLGSTVHDNAIWIFGGSNDSIPTYYNDFWWSDNGTTWQYGGTAPADTIATRDGASLIDFNGDLYVCGGGMENTNYVDVWKIPTTGGNIGTPILTHTFTGALGISNMVVYRNQLWVGIAILDNGTVETRAATSEDGTNWVVSSGVSYWGTNFPSEIDVFDNRLWVFGTDNILDNSHGNDVVYSTDGITWITATSEAPWTGKEGPFKAAFHNKFWIIGGANPTVLPTTEVWYTPAP